MGIPPLPDTLPFAPVIHTDAEYEATAARFWELVGSTTDLPLLLALRDRLRDYEQEAGWRPPMLPPSR